MFEAVLYLLKPNGRMPQIGDNDSGRFHIFAKREVLDMRYLLTLGAIFFKESNFKIKELGFCEEALWIFGERGYKIWQDLPENCLTNISSKAFPDTGWYIMRDNKDYMIISCGPNGQGGNGGHAHNDKLSFELCIDGKDIIIDPGTYVYTSEPEWRNKFRSTVYHNTIVINGKEQNRFDGKNLFGMSNDIGIKLNKWKSNEEYDFLDAQYSNNSLTHRRQIYFDKINGIWLIRDILRGNDRYLFEQYFHFAPLKLSKSVEIEYTKIEKNTKRMGEIVKEDITIKPEKGFSIQSKSGRKIIRVVPLLCKGLSLDIEQRGWISFSYGIKENAPVVKYFKSDSCPAEFLTAIEVI